MDTDINHIIQMSLIGDKNYQEILLEKLKPMIFKNIYLYWNPIDPITEDLEQEGYLLILESLRDFDENRNVHFLYYIKTRIIYFYKNYYRKTKRDRQNTYFSENMSNESSDSLITILKKELITELMTNIKQLTVKEQEVLYLNFYLQMGMKEIYQFLNVPYRTCIGRKYSAIKKLKKCMVDRR